MKDAKTHVVHRRQDNRNLQPQKPGTMEKLSALFSVSVQSASYPSQYHIAKIQTGIEN